MPSAISSRFSLLLAAAAVSSSGAAETPSFRADWNRALVLFKKKAFDEACPLFARASAAQPKNAAIWGDLGLCELKRGTEDSRLASIHASRMALRFGDERVRKAAYYNLGLAGVKEALPAHGCAVLHAPPEAECTGTAVACVRSWHTSGSVYRTFGRVAFVARTEKDASAARDAVSELDPQPEELGSGVVVEEEARNSCGSWCDLQAWQLDNSLIMAQALACEQHQRGPLSGPIDVCQASGKRCTDIFDCASAVLTHTSDSEAVRREWHRLKNGCLSECNAGSPDGVQQACSIVHVDPCKGHLGVVCSTPNPSGKGSKLQASEREILEPSPPEP